MQPRKLKIGIVRFPYSGSGGVASEHPDVGTWLAHTIPKIKADPRCEDGIWSMCFTDTPITMTRNRALRLAQQSGVDVLVMVDSDQNPDLYRNIDALAKPFWDSSFDFLYRHYDKGPCVVAAPYCGPLPHPVDGGASNVYVFRWAADQNDPDNRQFSLEQFTREEATIRAGIEEVAALPTGLCMIDLRACDLVDPPWFKYEWSDVYEQDKASTEDVVFTRNCSLQGIPQYCNWDAWAGHSKPSVVGKPVFITSDQVSDEFRKAVVRDLPADKRVCEIGVGESVADILEDLNVRTVTPLADALEGHGRNTLDSNIGAEIATALDRIGLELKPKFDADGRMRFGISTSTADLTVIAGLVRQMADEDPDRPLTIVEVGSWLGASALAMTEGFGPAGGTIHCVDTWNGSYTDLSGTMADLLGGSDNLLRIFKDAVGDRLGSTIVPHQMKSLDAARDWTLPLDLAFIDAGHRYQDVRRDIEVWQRHVRPGGILAGHDYHVPDFPDVTKAVDELSGVESDGAIWWLKTPAVEDPDRVPVRGG